MREYHKIYAPFLRTTEGENRNRLVMGKWLKPEFEFLANVDWIWTEKIDGTNIRVHWDGHKVSFGGRTDDAQIPAKLFDFLKNTFSEELFEQIFGNAVVTLYGEGFGAGIESGGNYSQTQEFILFDVLIDRWWLERYNVEDIARKLGIMVVPIIKTCTLTQMITQITLNPIISSWGMVAEGVVGTPAVPLFDRAGERIIVKVKEKDFRHLREGAR